MKRAGLGITSAARARWLSDLAGALAEAQKVAWKLGVSEGDSAEAKQLYGRIEAARAEVDRLRLNGIRRVLEESGPDWTDGGPWARKAESDA